MSRMIERVKEKYPHHRLYDEWDFELQQFTAEDIIEFAEEYAKEVAIASLDKASENIDYDFCFAYSSERSRHNEIVKSITNSENIVML